MEKSAFIREIRVQNQPGGESLRLRPIHPLRAQLLPIPFGEEP